MKSSKNFLKQNRNLLKFRMNLIYVPWGFANLRVHDLRHTFGRRLRAADVSKETRADLLGHKTGDITSHYSAAEIKDLIEAVEKITTSNLPEIYQTTLIRMAG